MPTLVEWFTEGVNIALEGYGKTADQAETIVAGAATAAEFYEGSARALRRLQPSEAAAAGVDVEKISANYMLQAAVGYSSGPQPAFQAAAKAVVQVIGARFLCPRGCTR